MPSNGIILALALIAPTTLVMMPPRAHASDGTLYEVSEAVTANAKGKVQGFKSSEATLSGTIKSGTPLCPAWVTAPLGIDSCWMIVHALGGADDNTGLGPVAGTIFVLVQGRNEADAPELKILSADFESRSICRPRSSTSCRGARSPASTATASA